MRIESTTHIDAPTDRVWSTMSDIARWPEWTASVSSARVLTDAPLAVGTRAELKQPGMPKAIWTVTELDDGTSFTWQARNPGLLSTGTHSVRTAADGGTDAVLVFDQRGALAGLMSLLFGRKSRRFVAMEAAGLRADAERQDA